MESAINIIYINEPKTCMKCKKIFAQQDIIPLCAECRYIESQYNI